MAQKPHLLPYLSRRARFERLEPSSALHITPKFDLTLSQPQAANLAALDPRWRLELSSQLYQADCRGAWPARQALCSYLASRAPLGPDDLLLTASTSEAYAYLLLALCDPGDAVLVPNPGYPLLDDIAQLLSIRLVSYSLKYDGSWFVDTSTLPDQAQTAQDKIRAIVVISPHHPTGHVLSNEERVQLEDCGVPFIVDEVFQPYILDTDPRDSDPLKMGSTGPLCLVLGGLSKSVAAPGLKLGWIVGRGRGAREFLGELEFVSDAFLSVNQLVEEGLPQILSQAPLIQHKIRERLTINRFTARRVFEASPVSALPVRSGWSMILRLPHIRDECTWRACALEVGIQVQPGSLYALPFHASFVVSLLTEPSPFEQALIRLNELVTALARQAESGAAS